jgi:hypothetical protein
MRQYRDPGRLDLFGGDQRAALFFGLHFSEVSPRPDEARPFNGIVWCARLRLQRSVAQIADIATHRPDQIVLAAFGLRDYALAAQLLDPTFRQIQQPRNHADGLGCR